MEKVVRGEKTLQPWSPPKKEEIDKIALLHIDTLGLYCPTALGDPETANIILYDLGGFENDPVLKTRRNSLFTRQNKLCSLVSTFFKTYMPQIPCQRFWNGQNSTFV
jgi:hypothetical protein